MWGYVPRIRFVLCTLLLGMAPLAAHAAPARVVSIGACSDQWLLAVADRKQVAGLGQFSTIRDVSAYAGEAGGIPQHNDRVENIATLKPDLVIADEWSPSLTLHMVERLGIPILKLPTPNALEELPPVITQLGKALGRERQAARINADYQKQLARLKAAAKRVPHLRAVLYRPNGYSPGLETVPGNIIQASGLENLSSTLGMKGSISLPFERFVYYKPALWIQDVSPNQRFGLGEEIMRSPVIQDMNITTVRIPLSQWFCLTPRSLQAIETLQQAAIEKGREP